jgi:hypothetical protein
MALFKAETTFGPFLKRVKDSNHNPVLYRKLLKHAESHLCVEFHLFTESHTLTFGAIRYQQDILPEWTFKLRIVGPRQKHQEEVVPKLSNVTNIYGTRIDGPILEI